MMNGYSLAKVQYINKIYCTFALYKDNSNNKQ
jgi:hypothetical protein